MGKELENEVLQEHPYTWSEKSSVALPDFLTKYKPSMVQNDGTKPWIWVRGHNPNPDTAGAAAALEEAAVLLKDVLQRIEEIKNDDSIPMRSNEKTGAKTKREVREQVQADAAEKLKNISIKHNYVCGKWLIFAPSDKVDAIWSRIATSLVSGPLASTCAFLTKVATSPAIKTPHHRHVICLYVPDVYDKNAVTDVMKVLLRHHGVNLSGVKSDLYTGLGLDSKHPSGMQSTVWKNTPLLKDSEIKELKDAYFSDMNAAKKSSAKQEAEDKISVSKKKKPILKKKAQDDDPFASEGEADAEEAGRKQAVQTMKKTEKRPQPSDMDADDGDELESKKVKSAQ